MAQKTFESAMKRLEEITTQLEQGQLTLDESMKLYEEGTKLSAYCSGELEKAQLKIKQLTDCPDDGE